MKLFNCSKNFSPIITLLNIMSCLHQNNLTLGLNSTNTIPDAISQNTTYQEIKEKMCVLSNNVKASSDRYYQLFQEYLPLSSVEDQLKELWTFCVTNRYGMLDYNLNRAESYKIAVPSHNECVLSLLSENTEMGIYYNFYQKIQKLHFIYENFILDNMNEFIKSVDEINDYGSILKNCKVANKHFCIFMKYWKKIFAEIKNGPNDINEYVEFLNNGAEEYEKDMYFEFNKWIESYKNLKKIISIKPEIQTGRAESNDKSDSMQLDDNGVNNNLHSTNNSTPNISVPNICIFILLSIMILAVIGIIIYFYAK